MPAPTPHRIHRPRLVTRLLPLLLVAPLAAQQPALRLEGMVLDPHQQPVPGARIEVLRDGAVIATTASDALGVFALTKLPAAEVAVRATTDEPAIGGLFVDLATERRPFVRVAMLPARAVAGTVRDADGAPVAAAFVAAVLPGARDFGAAAATATTDAAGRFRFAHAPLGPLALRCYHPDHAGGAAIVAEAGDLDVEFAVGDDEVRREFVLRHASAGQLQQARVEVYAFADGAPVPLPPAVAAPPQTEPGTWTVRGWSAADEMHAHVALDGAFVEPICHTIPPATGDRTKEFYVEEAEAALVRGRLGGGAGIRVGGRALVAMGQRRGFVQTAFTTTAADGSFTLLSPTPTGTSFVLRCLDDDVVLRPGVEFSWLVPTDLCLRHRPGTLHEVDLLPAVTLRARLVTADGAPCPGADFVVLTEPHDSMCRVGNGGFQRTNSARLLVRGRTDARGELHACCGAFTNVDKVVVQFLGPDGFVQLQPDLDPAEQDLGEIRIEPGAVIEGRVLRADGSGWPGARVEICNHSLLSHEQLLVADRDGRFAVRGLGPGPTWIGIAGTKRGEMVRIVADEQVEVRLR